MINGSVKPIKHIKLHKLMEEVNNTPKIIKARKFVRKSALKNA